MAQNIITPKTKTTKSWKVSIDWNPKFVSTVNKDLTVGGRLQKFIDSSVLAGVDPYWARRTGTAIRSGILNTVIGSGLLVYSTPYIRTIFYGVTAKGAPISYNTAYNAKAGKRPDLRYKAEKMAELQTAVNAKAREIFNQ